VAGLLEVADAEKVDLVTGFPRFELGSPIERVMMPAVGAVIVARYPPAKVMDPKSAVAFANGQIILVRRALYEAAGGHAAVVAEVLEDSALATRVKQAGGKLMIADARKIASTRMYESWSDLVEGWSKNLFLLMGQSVSATLGWGLASVVIGAAGLATMVATGFSPLGIAAYAVTLVMQGTLRAMGGAEVVWAMFAPLGGIGVAYLLLRSMALHLARRGVSWKGRKYVTLPKQ
jgi:hypothetical protein